MQRAMKAGQCHTMQECRSLHLKSGMFSFTLEQKIKEHKLRKLRAQSLHHKLGVRIRSFPEMTKTDKALGLSLSLV